MCSCRLWLRFSLVLLTLAFCVGAPQLNPPAAPAAEFSSHREIYPSLQHARTKRDLSSTRDENGTHHPEVLMTITVDGEEHLLSLRLNEDLVTAEHTIAYQKDGELVFYKPTKEEMDLCHYSGVVQGKPGSWAALSTCKGVSGAIYDGQKALAIEPAEDSEISNRHYLYDFDDFKTNDKHYSVDLPEPEQSVNRHKRNVENEEILMPHNSNNSSRYVELLLVVDNGMYKKLNSSIPAVHAYVIKLNNILNSYYTPLNIYTALVGVEVWNEQDKISTAKPENETRYDEGVILYNFSDYLFYNYAYLRDRELFLPFDHAQLLISEEWGPLGWSFPGSMCTDISTSIVVSIYMPLITAGAMAHEIGHTLGMNHTDSESCSCPDGNCFLMPAAVLSPYLHWSSCNIKVAAEANVECLLNKPTYMFSSPTPTCGNGFVEVGEQCDCGQERCDDDITFNYCSLCCSRTCQLQQDSYDCRLLKEIEETQSVIAPAAEFSSHREIYPSLQHARTKRDLSSTRDENGTHHPEVLMTITVDGEEHLLSLRLNEDLVTAEHTIAYQKDGEMVFYKPTKEEMDLCHYSGVVQGKPGSWAALSTCKGVSGAIFDGQKALAIEPAEDSEISNRHYLYDFDDFKTNKKHPSVDLPEPEQSVNRHKRNVENEQILIPYNSNNSSRYVELLLVVDNGLYKRLNMSIPAVHAYVIRLNNILNSIYTPLNIYTALVGVEVWNEQDKISTAKPENATEHDLGVILNNFSNYLKSIHAIIPNDHAQLLTSNVWLNVAVAGWSLPGSMCKDSTSIVPDIDDFPLRTAEHMAREIGHTLGINQNESESCPCPDGNCIMMPSYEFYLNFGWSSCNIKDAAEANFECLLNKPTKLFSSPTCGNGFLEVGEQCDCGVDSCDQNFIYCNACCSRSCKLQQDSYECGLSKVLKRFYKTKSELKIMQQNKQPTTVIPEVLSNDI